MNKIFSIGCDEAGRGAWAGPIVAAAILAREETIPETIKDSKLLKEKERQELAFYIIKNYTFGIGLVSPKMIDLYGITYANALAFERALRHLGRKGSFPPYSEIRIDGRKLPISPRWKDKTSFHEKGESKFKTVAAASIIAKTYRDNLLKERDKKEPQWGWSTHKGYGTQKHTKALKDLPPIPGFHRFSYRPIKEFLNYHGSDIKTG